MIYGLIAAVLALVLDQISKFCVQTHFFENSGFLEVTSFFNIVHMWNRGVSFSMFNNWGNVGVYLLSAFAITVVLALLWWMYKEKDLLVRIALGLIIGGALGNVIDRVRFGKVFDFLDFHIEKYHWPVFNGADTFICIGAFIIIMAGFINKRKEEKK